MSESKSLSVIFSGSSNTGLRKNNQDAFAAHQPQTVMQRNDKGVVACIADGVSCSENGQQASQMSVTQFIEDYYSTPDTWGVKKSVQRVLTALNTWLYHHSQQTELRHNGLVSTFSCLIAKSTTAHLFHVGDSRIYRYRDGELTQLTKDHCRHQFGDKSLLTRALGIDSNIEIDYLTCDLKHDDIYMFTTDGVHEWLTHTQLSAALTAELCLDLKVSHIIEAAKQAGSDDNLTCLLMKITDLPSADMLELKARLLHKVIPPVMAVGHKIDHFQIIKVIHSGSRSHLYLVNDLDTHLNRLMKVPSLHYQEDAAYRWAFAREQWIGERTQHPLLMTLEPNESRFLYQTRPYIEGMTLRQWMYDNPKPSLPIVRELVASMVTAIRVLQRLGVIHRDLKPDNMMLTAAGHIVLIDYGAAYADALQEWESEDELPLGDVRYMAPEYIDSQSSHQSDIFSIGIIIYEMLTGETPYKVSPSVHCQHRPLSQWQYRSLIRHRQDIPLWFDRVLNLACHPDVHCRYQSMSELVVDLSTPNSKTLDVIDNMPLLARDPVLFWRSLSILLAILLLISFLI